MRELPPQLRGRPADAVREAPNARRALAMTLARRAGLAVVVAVFLAFGGAFGSARAPMGLRLAFWLLAMLGGSAIGGLSERMTERFDWIERRPLPGAVLRSLAIAAPITVWVVAVAAVLFPGTGFTAARLGEFFLPTLAVSTVMVALTMLIDRVPPTTHAAPALQDAGDAPAPVPAAAAPAAADPARLLARLPPRLQGATLHAVQAEDHYLRLHTARGSDLVLMRLADALAELDGIEGAQVHRSWWVARAAVHGSRRDEGRVTLLLPDGVQAPVSRTYVKALRDAGWFTEG